MVLTLILNIPHAFERINPMEGCYVYHCQERTSESDRDQDGR